MAERRWVPLFTVTHWRMATWRYATGHERAGEVSRVEWWQGLSDTYCVNRETGEIRVG